MRGPGRAVSTTPPTSKRPIHEVTMSAAIYQKLAKVLDTLPCGYPATPDGLELKLLEKIFTPEEAELFCDLKLSPETAQQVAERTGRPLEGLEEQLIAMSTRGEIMGIELGGAKLFSMVPWMPGIWEFQINRMDREFCQLWEEYAKYFDPQLMNADPYAAQIIPIGQQLTAKQEARPWIELSAIIEQGKGFRLGECVCKKERSVLHDKCTKPTEVCLTISPVAEFEHIFDWGKPISKEQAYQLLRDAEEAGLVHLTSNVASGHTFICNCCGCCCAVLRPINEFNLTGVVNSHFYAEIDADTCDNCAICKDERCQVQAIELGDMAHQVIKARCIGCGLCVTTCPQDAVKLVHKPQDEISLPLPSYQEWNDARARARGTDYSAYK
jgi:electron transport complex protein RnfB